MKISLKQLKVYVAVAKYGSITQAAEHCFISQPATTMALQQLESMLGYPLFDRMGKRLVLNSNGGLLLDKANAIIDQTSELESFISSDPQQLSGTLKIGASLTIGNYILPSYLATFKQSHPHGELKVEICNTEKIVSDLLAFKIDIGLIEGHCYDQSLECQTWLLDELVVFGCMNHPLAKKTTIQLNDLAKFNWALREKGSGTGLLIEEYLYNKFPLNPEILLNSFEAIKRYVANSHCLSCVSKHVLQSTEKVDLTIFDVRGFNLTRPLYILINPAKYITGLSQTFQTYLQR